MDLRLEIIGRRLASVSQVIAVAGGKGGVGKSSVAAGLALVLATLGHRVGLLDLDFYGPSTHLILGIAGVAPREEKGIIPPEVHGIQFMSIVYFSGENPSPMRGLDVSNALIELLAITRWGGLDFLVVDMPPGIGDTTLDAIRLLKKAQFLVVTTPSRVALETVKKLVALLRELHVPIIGAVENMRRPSDPLTGERLLNIPLLGSIPYDDQMEETLGDTEKFLKTAFVRKLREVVLRTGDFKVARR